MKIIYPPKKAFIKSMIRDHLLSYRLLHGLEAIGFDITSFDLYLSDNIFSLLGFGDSAEEEELFQDFLQWSERILEVEFSIINQEPMEILVNEIYRRLEKEQKLRKWKKWKNRYSFNPSKK
ncbi:MAG TPA: hypothetical protein VLB84_09235 [Bacteroidia bacterium]|nr:hypothetical protein [Bacteroidia bacterium]